MTSSSAFQNFKLNQAKKLVMGAEYDRLESKVTNRENPKKNASIFSILTFWWVREILATGNKRPLENEDLFPLLDEDKTQTSAKKLQLTWNEETAKRVPGKKGSGYRLFRALFRMLPWTDYLYLLGMTFLFAVCKVLQPAFLSLLLLELMEATTDDKWWTYIYGAGICLSQFLNAVANHQIGFHGDLMSLRWKSATMAIIYQKVRRFLIINFEIKNRCDRSGEERRAYSIFSI